MSDSPLEALLKRDRAIVLASLAAVTVLCWLSLIRMAQTMADMPMDMGDAVAMTQTTHWTAQDFVMMFVMWVVMMIGMMTPTAAPMVLVFARFSRSQKAQGRPNVPTGAFLAGYLSAWTGFSLVATVLQWALDQAALLSPMMVSNSPLLGGVILLAGGVFQLTPLKNACLTHCRSPLDFFMGHWRPGAVGAFRMGLAHGAFCLGCCWLLMGLLFFGGVMNLLWIGTITIFVLLEKVAPHGLAIARVSGFALIAAGIFVVAQAQSL